MITINRLKAKITKWFHYHDVLSQNDLNRYLQHQLSIYSVSDQYPQYPTLWLSLDRSAHFSLRFSTCNRDRQGKVTWFADPDLPSIWPPPRLLGGALGRSHQVVLAVLGAQHGSHFLQVAAVAALLATGGEAERDDPLGDVDQVHLVALLHGLHHTLAPAGGEVEGVDLITKSFLKSANKCCVSFCFVRIENNLFNKLDDRGRPGCIDLNTEVSIAIGSILQVQLQELTCFHSLNPTIYDNNWRFLCFVLCFSCWWN